LGVDWPVRARRLDEQTWRDAQSVNLSVTGILLQAPHRFHVGERLELEIEFLVHPEMKTIVRGVGVVVREDRASSWRAAIRFDADGVPMP
jgi:hypothetical protein